MPASQQNEVSAPDAAAVPPFLLDAAAAAARRARNALPMALRLSVRALPWVGLGLTLWDMYQLWKMYGPGSAGRWGTVGYTLYGTYAGNCGHPQHIGPGVCWSGGSTSPLFHQATQFAPLLGTGTWLATYQHVYSRFATLPAGYGNTVEIWKRDSPAPALSGTQTWREVVAPLPRPKDRPIPPPLAAPGAIPRPVPRPVRDLGKAADGTVIGGSVAGPAPVPRPNVGGAGSVVPATKWTWIIDASGVRFSGAKSSHHVMARAPARTWEQKFRAPSANTYAFSRGLADIFGQATEILDATDVLYQALPKNTRQYFGRWWSTADPVSRAQLLWDERENIDFGEAVVGLLLNEAQDRLIGAGSAVEAAVVREVGLPTTFSRLLPH